MQRFVLNIPYYSALFDSSTSPSPPVTQMNDSNMNEEMNMGDAARQAAAFFEQLLHTPGPRFNNNNISSSDMQANAAQYGDQHPAQFVNLSPAHAIDPLSYTAASTNNPAAMLQLLTALNGPDHQHYQQLLNLSAPAAVADYHQLAVGGPATLNFFQASSTNMTDSTSLHLHHAAAAAPHLDHNLLQLAHGGTAGLARPSCAGNAPGFLNFFNGQLHHGDLSRPAGSISTGTAGNSPLASPCLQLQPLERHPLLGSPPTLFQKRAAQRRQHGSAGRGATSYTGTSCSSASSKAKLQLMPPVPVSTPTALTVSKSPSSFSNKQQLSGSSSASAGALSDPLLGAELQHTSLPEVADEGGEKLHAENDYNRQNQLIGLGRAVSDHGFTLAADIEEDNCAEALFHMHDPELQRMEAVHGGSTHVHDHTTEDDELLLLQSEGGEESNLQLAAASASEQQKDSASNPTRGNGRGKVKGPPAKNLMAERRRRKKLNDRLYTLRSVVPKISKMDRASILGDAIEYLKELLQRINDLHNELEASSTPATGPMMPGGFPPPPTPSSFTNQSSSASLTPTSHSAGMNLPAHAASSSQLVKLEDCPSTTTSSTQLQLQSMCGAPAAGSGPGPDPSLPPKIEVRMREGRALNIHMFCGRRPGLLLATMRALDGLGLDVQQAVISCFNGFALDVFRAEQSPEEDVAVEEIKRVLLHTATSAPASLMGSGGSY